MNSNSGTTSKFRVSTGFGIKGLTPVALQREQFPNDATQTYMLTQIYNSDIDEEVNLSGLKDEPVDRTVARSTILPNLEKQYESLKTQINIRKTSKKKPPSKVVTPFSPVQITASLNFEELSQKTKQDMFKVNAEFKEHASSTYRQYLSINNQRFYKPFTKDLKIDHLV